MKGLVLIGDYYEDTELIATIDVLLRHNEELVLASMMKRNDVTSKLNLVVHYDKLIEEVSLNNFDFLFIPGGPGSFQVLSNIPQVDLIINHFVKNNKLVASICAAPFLVGRLSHLNNHSFTCYPGFEKQVVGGTYLRDKGVVRDGNFITGKSMYYSIDLGLEIIEYFYGKEEKEKLKLSLMGEE